MKEAPTRCPKCNGAKIVPHQSKEGVFVCLGCWAKLGERFEIKQYGKTRTRGS